ncbi:MAG: biotin--[acetyl-CoA-carboxylase] ligase, partial [Actinomycetota bacterium]|nr:biotin--[acetyl-CoA-carboxylase] ligase [Actinomycetota bacterium]
LDALRAVLQAYDGLPDDVMSMYRDALSTLGRRVRVQQLDGVTVGVATDVEPDGRLVIVDACALTHRFHAGDVVHVRSDDP